MPLDEPLLTQDRRQELNECTQDPPPGTKVSTINDDVHKWEILMDGPEQSIYSVRRSARAPDSNTLEC